MALSFLNGTGGPHIFSPSLAQFILGIKETSTSLKDIISELPEDQVDIKDKLKSLDACKTSEDWASAFMTFDQRFDMGINKATVPFHEKDEVIRAAVKHIMITSALEEIYSFLEGLSLFGVFSVLKEYPEDAYKELTYIELTEDVEKTIHSIVLNKGILKQSQGRAHRLQLQSIFKEMPLWPSNQNDSGP